MLFTGLVIGFVPVALAAPMETSRDSVQFLVWRSPNLRQRRSHSRWLDRLFPVHRVRRRPGAAGAITFYYVYRDMSSNNSFKPNPLRASAQFRRQIP